MIIIVDAGSQYTALIFSMLDKEMGVKVSIVSFSEIDKHYFASLSEEKGSKNESQVWMSHNDTVINLPEEFHSVARTNNCKNAVVEHKDLPIFLTQFHPEVKNTELGQLYFRNFLKICGFDLDLEKSKIKKTNGFTKKFEKTAEMTEKMITDIRSKVGENSVLLALSGGTDSSILCHLLAKALPGKLYCVYMDSGLMRKNETEEIRRRFSSLVEINLVVVQAADRFYRLLEGVTDPEKKRKIIGKEFVEVFEEQIDRFSPKPAFLAQGTIYPDVIESNKQKNGALIKSHHNVGGLPDKLKLKLLEPFRFLFKDQVREIGEFLRVEKKTLSRHPFPGPGLAVRVIGECSPSKLNIAREADFIFINMLRKERYLTKISQAFASLLPVKMVGVVGDNRRYGFCVVLRAVVTEDFMTASVFEFPIHFLSKVASEIVGTLPDVARVFYDVTSKPPGTIELE